MTRHPDYDALTMIQDLDPCGMERRPTQADFDAHRKWAIRTYGSQVWLTYMSANWAPVGADPA